MILITYFYYFHGDIIKYKFNTLIMILIKYFIMVHIKYYNCDYYILIIVLVTVFLYNFIIILDKYYN